MPASTPELEARARVAAPHLHPRRASPRGADVLAFAAPALLAVEVGLTGRLFATELLLLASVPFLALGRLHAPLNRRAALIVVVGMIWLWGQVFTDLVRETAFVDFARGWMKIFFTLSTLIALALLCTSSVRRLVLFAVGLTVGLLTQYYLSPDALALADPWKFGLGLPFTILMALAASHRAARTAAFLPTVIMAIAAVVNLERGFRSLAGICFLTAAYLGIQHLRALSRRRASRVSRARLVTVGGAMLLFAFVFVEGYGAAAERGWLGEEAAQKHAYQSSERVGSVIFGGRPTLLIGINAIRDSVFVGHGSWARDARYVSEAVADLVQHGYAVDPRITHQLLKREEIPSHSYLLGAWVEGGVLGGAFWILVLAFAANLFLNFYRIEDRLAPLVVFFGVFLCWNIFFSPYGAEQRILAPYAIVLMLYARSRLSHEDESMAGERDTPTAAQRAIKPAVNAT